MSDIIMLCPATMQRCLSSGCVNHCFIAPTSVTYRDANDTAGRVTYIKPTEYVPKADADRLKAENERMRVLIHDARHWIAGNPNKQAGDAAIIAALAREKHRG